MAKLKDGFYKLTAEAIGSDLYVLLAGGGSKALSDFATASEAVTALGTNGNYVTWTKNGTVNNLIVPYATSSSNTNLLNAIELSNLSLGSYYTPFKHYFAGGNNTVSDKPTGVDAFGVINLKTASGLYGLILMASNTATNIYWRTGTTLSGGWRVLLDSTNSSVSKSGQTLTVKINGVEQSLTNTTYTSLKNPNAIKFKKTDGTTVTYDGSSAADLTGGVNYAASAGSVAWSNITGKPTFAAVAISGSYNDLSNKPAIPTVGNGTVTIKQGGTTKGSFTMNQSGSTTIALTDTNTDTKVTQTVTSSNASYPLLLAPSGQTSNTTTTSYFDSGVTLNPSTNTISANITGSAGSAGSVNWSGVKDKPVILTGGSQTTTSTSDGGNNVFTFTKSDGSTSTLTVKNGSKGSQGDPGTSVSINSTSVTYQASSSGTTIPTSTWSSSIPSVSKGLYLWTKTVVIYSSGNSTTSYSVGYMGTNGSNGVTPTIKAAAGSNINSVGIPSVTASTSGTTTTFTFNNLKGAKGDPGENATTTATATWSSNGLMSALDKSKLDGIAESATCVIESTVIGWGFTKNTGTYSKPSGGIPASDLDLYVQRDLYAFKNSVASTITETDINLWNNRNVDYADNAGNANFATNASYADNAGYASNAGSASNANTVDGYHIYVGSTPTSYNDNTIYIII